MRHIKLNKRASYKTIAAIGFAWLLLSWQQATPAASESPAETPGASEKSSVAVLLEVKGAIGPAVSDFVERGLATAKERGARLVILRMDTPGGLDTSMREIIQAILASPVPVVTYVAPSGSRAASAGTYILYASHIAAMAPGTNLGAATPVRIGGTPTPLPGSDDKKKPKSKPAKESSDDVAEANGDKDEKSEDVKEADSGAPRDAMSAKAVNDATAYIRSLAEMRGRNADWAERAVRSAASLSANAAREQNVIDVVATDIDDLLAQVNGKTVTVDGAEHRFDTAGLVVEEFEPDWRTEFLSVITNPNVAFIFMLLGVYGLIFELANPGAIVPGTIGAISLILALYSLNLLPIDYAGLALVILGLALMIVEAFTPTFGILGVGGIVAFVVGSTFLFDSDLPGLSLSWPVIIGTAITSSGLLIFVLAMAVRAHRRPVVAGREFACGKSVRVTSWSGDGGRVLYDGEDWRAESSHDLSPGQQVRIVEIRDLTLVVEPE